MNCRKNLNKNEKYNWFKIKTHLHEFLLLKISLLLKFINQGLNDPQSCEKQSMKNKTISFCNKKKTKQKSVQLGTEREREGEKKRKNS